MATKRIIKWTRRTQDTLLQNCEVSTVHPPADDGVRLGYRGDGAVGTVDLYRRIQSESAGPLARWPKTSVHGLSDPGHAPGLESLGLRPLCHAEEGHTVTIG